MIHVEKALPHAYLIFARQYFARLYLRDFDRGKWKKGIKFHESAANILFSKKIWTTTFLNKLKQVEVK